MNRRKVLPSKMITEIIIALLVLFSFSLETKNTTSPFNNCQITKEFDHGVMMKKVIWIDMRPAPSS